MKARLAALAGVASVVASVVAGVAGVACTPSATSTHAESGSSATSDAGDAADGASGSNAAAPADLVSESWQTDDGPVTMLKSASARLSVSSGCKKADGSLDCDAYRFVTQPVHVELGGNAHGTSQGTLRCVRSHHPLVTAHDAQGNQDGLCKFADGSYATTGSIESRPMP